MTRPVDEELESLRQYLATQTDELHVSIDSTVPADRHLIPGSLVLIVQHAQQHNRYPLRISIGFSEYTAEISYRLNLRAATDNHFLDMDELDVLYSYFFSQPTVNQKDDRLIISIPLFI